MAYAYNLAAGDVGSIDMNQYGQLTIYISDDGTQHGRFAESILAQLVDHDPAWAAERLIDVDPDGALRLMVELANVLQNYRTKHGHLPEQHVSIEQSELMHSMFTALRTGKHHEI